MPDLELKLATDHTPPPRSIARYRLRLIHDTNTPYEALPRCNRCETAAQFLHDLLREAYQETMGSLLLDGRGRAIGHHLAYRGTLNRCAVEPRGLLVPALLANAAGFIAFHNHPSGDATPSIEDRAFTRRLADAGEIVGVRLLDHLVLGERPQYTSLYREGHLWT